jgi:hypothetical protein
METTLFPIKPKLVDFHLSDITEDTHSALSSDIKMKKVLRKKNLLQR